MLSKGVYILCIALILYVSLIFNPKWNNKAGESSLGWDAATYYWYLPATFIYKDLKEQKFGDSIIRKYRFTPTFSQSFVHESGNRVIVYSSGVALLSLPAFAAGHAIAEYSAYPADGFSEPYQVAVQLWAICIGLIAIWFFRKLLLMYFSDRVTAIILVMLVFGTNYLNYASYDVTITHSYLFTIYVLLLLNTHHFYTTPLRKYAIRIGLLTGLAVLIRPSEIIAILIPLLWGMETLSRNAFRDKLSFLKNNAAHIAIAVSCSLAIASIQVIYWLYVTGQPFVYSYDDKTFSWLAPHTWKYLTSYRSGWLMYNPMVLFIIIGIVPFIKYGKNKVAILSFFVLNLYIVSAWDIWWYSGIGGRAMMQSYAVIFFIAGVLFEYVLRKKIRRWIAAPFFLLFIYINLWVFYNAHASNSLYDSVSMSKQYYWAVIGRWQVDNETLKLQDAREIYTGILYGRQLLYQNDFETEPNAHPELAINGTKSLYARAGSNSGVYVIPGNPDDRKWMRIECTYKSFNIEWEMWNMLRTRVHFKNGDKEIKGEDYRPQRFLRDSSQKTIHYDIRIPKEHFDRIEISFLNDNSVQELLVDDLKVWIYNDDK